jgi:DNA mismatch repair protein MutS2
MRHRVPGVVHDASKTGATLFVEPFATVDLCNAWRELVLEEERETQMVLSELSGLVAEAAGDIERGTALTAELDFILARARYGMASSEVTRIDQGGRVGSVPKDRPVNTHLADARHPLLQEAVPITVSIGPGWTVLVITGPNTGGKTVAMKTVGLLALMHQSGLRVPAEEGSSLPVFDGIYADVGDQQSIQQSVSTFGSRMRNVIDILENATSESLILLDELGTSTDPEEGSALAKAILAHLASRKVATVATTHHRTVAAYVEATPGMMNASVDLDPSTLKPTYHLTFGVPGRSYAMSVAAQMGLPKEIMREAESLLEPQYMRFEEWLSELQQSRDQLKLRLEEAEEAQRAAATVRRDLEAELADIASRREDILIELREELTVEYEGARKSLRRAESILSWSATGTDVEEAKAEITAATEELKALDKRASQSAPQRGDRPLAVGDTVNVRGLNVQGTVVSLPDKGGEAEVAIGEVRFSLDVHRLSQAEEAEAREPHDSGISYDLGPVLATADLDLRGWRVEDAKIRIEEFLDKAVRDGLSSVRIIHGKGTGALRQAARELLEGHPLAKSFAPEAPDRGGDGATVVDLT